MQPHVKIYLNHFNIGEQENVTCEACLREGRADLGGFDIHHINGRGKGKDMIDNLMCLCRRCHTNVHKGELNKGDCALIHNYFLSGKRIKFVK